VSSLSGEGEFLPNLASLVGLGTRRAGSSQGYTQEFSKCIAISGNTTHGYQQRKRQKNRKIHAYSSILWPTVLFLRAICTYIYVVCIMIYLFFPRCSVCEAARAQAYLLASYSIPNSTVVIYLRRVSKEQVEVSINCLSYTTNTNS